MSSGILSDASAIDARITCLAPGSFINRGDEALLVVFHDTSRPDARPRESIEFRSVAYFS